MHPKRRGENDANIIFPDGIAYFPAPPKKKTKWHVPFKTDNFLNGFFSTFQPSFLGAILVFGLVYVYIVVYVYEYLYT